MNSLITEKIVTSIYKKGNIEELAILEEEFFKVCKNHQLFIDWLAYDYLDKNKEPFSEVYYPIDKEAIPKEDEEYLKAALTSFVGVYEVDRFEENYLILKDVFTRFKIKVSKDEMDEEIEKYDIVIGRFMRSPNGRLLGSAVISLPCQFKTILVGHIVEEYDRKRNLEASLTYEEFFKKYPLVLLKIVTSISSYKNQRADLTVYQSVYAVKDHKRVRSLLRDMDTSPEINGNEEIFSLSHKGRVVAEIVLSEKNLEVECKSSSERQKLRSTLEAKLGKDILHIRDENLTIDDIL
ncbi:hypothetical protein [Alkaliphilus serpentinus]|uniref:Uncharacterized protein n=1 Tax=Alkaliphilus serpentinus TaxID=1482731 RepID=A0A833HPH1_9FIRM|nr:hypothetical protein [Alkaliphilus serpentinus]KAB3530724.1 hypothetical protein F8153_06340 [Alkaliphilus serpentinus]